MTEKLVDLPEVSQLSPRIVRILGGNPGKFTLQGTNTYLVSTTVSQSSSEASTSSIPCILVDTGEGMSSYTAAMKKVLQGQDNGAGKYKRHITDIILTHRHHDHVGGLSSVLTLLSDTQSEAPRLHKYPDSSDESIIKQLQSMSSSSYQADNDKSPLRPLKDGDKLQVPLQSAANESGATTLQVVHTPGHTSDHICLLLPEEGALLTGDHVLGQGTSVFEDLGSYLSSLQKCSSLLQEQSPSKEARLYPAHGPTIEEGKKALQGYLSHRIERENQVLELLATKPPTSSTEESDSSSGWTIKSIVSTLYSNYPEHLYPAAARGIFLHLQKLAQPDSEAIGRGVVANSSHQGRRVECIGQGAGKEGDAPRMPTGDAEWFQVMSLEWKLLDHSSSASIEKESL